MENLEQQTTKSYSETINESERNKKEVVVENPLSRILDLIDREYYTFANNLEALENESKNNTKKAELLNNLFKLLETTPEELKKVIDIEITNSIEKINLLAKSRGIEISPDNSLTDILGNSIITGLNSANKVIDLIQNEKIESINELSETKKQLLSLLKKSFVDIPYYLNNICENEEKFKSELTSRVGYLEKFEKHFNKNESGITMFPTGGKKIAYIRMFDQGST